METADLVQAVANIGIPGALVCWYIVSGAKQHRELIAFLARNLDALNRVERALDRRDDGGCVHPFTPAPRPDPESED